MYCKQNKINSRHLITPNVTWADNLAPAIFGGFSDGPDRIALFGLARDNQQRVLGDAVVVLEMAVEAGVLGELFGAEAALEGAQHLVNGPGRKQPKIIFLIVNMNRKTDEKKPWTKRSK